MRAPYTLLFLVGLLLAALPSAAAKQPLTVRLVLGGEMFDGGPAFDVEADGRKIGKGVVTVASGEDFRFTVPDDLDPQTIIVRFTNDKYDAELKRDRNLIIWSVTVGQQQILGKDLSFPENKGRPVAGALLLSHPVAAAFSRPPSGWLLTSEEASSIETAAADAALPDCASIEPVVVGFPISSSDIPAQALETIGAFAASSKASECGVVVSGYASASGPAEWNRTLAETRARSVADYLLRSGISRDAISVEAVGQTGEFGSDADNRRVTIRARSVN